MTLDLGGLPAPAVVEFKLAGQPRPQGSKNARIVWPKGGGRPFAIVHDVEDQKLKQWRKSIVTVCASLRPSMPWLPLQGPLAVGVVFSVNPPLVIPPSRRGLPCVTAPGVSDVDKLLRAALDALKTGGIYTDDGQVCLSLPGEVYSGGPYPSLPTPGARFRIQTIEDAELLPHAAMDLAKWIAPRD